MSQDIEWKEIDLETLTIWMENPVTVAYFREVAGLFKTEETATLAAVEEDNAHDSKISCGRMIGLGFALGLPEEKREDFVRDVGMGIATTEELEDDKIHE